MATFETEFPQIMVRGCYFHFNQALWRAIQRHGLVNAYRISRRLKKCVKKVMALGSLQLPIVRLNFNRLWQSRSTRCIIRMYPPLDNFFTYFSNNYINGNIPPRIWKVFNRPMEIRTNNHVESYHRRWNQAVYVRHPSIWSFIRVLKDQQSLNEVTVRNIRSGDQPPLRRRKWRRLEQRINENKIDCNNGQINLSQYWRAITPLILNIV